MGVVVGLLLGAGLVSIWWSAWEDDREERPRTAWAAQWQDVIVQAGMGTTTPRALAALSVTLSLVTGLFVLALTGALPVAVCFALMALAAPLALVRSRARRRRARLRDAWPEVVDQLASAVRAGMTLPEALSQLERRGPVELRPPFAVFAREYRASGRFEDCLGRLKDRLADPVADRLIAALHVTREVGGTDLGRLLRTLSMFLREDGRTRGELEARQSWTVAGARLAVAAPWVVLALLCTRPETAAAYSTVSGAVVLAVGAGSTIVAYQAMLRIGRLPEDVRVLR